MNRIVIIIVSLFLILFVSHSNGQCLENDSAFINFFTKNINDLDPIEGIWSLSSSMNLYQNEKLIGTDANQNTSTYGIIRQGDLFQVCLISSNVRQIIKSSSNFKKTSIDGLYLYTREFTDLSIKVGSNASLNSNSLIEFSYMLPTEVVEFALKKEGKDPSVIRKENIQATGNIKMVKIFPLENDFRKKGRISASGFAISSNGMILTNYHVIENAGKINVRGIKGDFEQTLSAKIVLSDKNNDLALIKIEDKRFISCGSIPFVISNSKSNVGESVFVLGYPLRATMGDEIKLTTGVISANSGFKGDITSYQISAPVQPGNSGGPLFSSEGNLIGVTNAKNTEAENASYAIKSNYILNLIESLPDKLNLNKINELTNKSLPDKVKILRKFVYIIEVN